MPRHLEPSLKRPDRTACSSCRKLCIRCDDYSTSTCARCHRKSLPCDVIAVRADLQTDRTPMSRGSMTEGGLGLKRPRHNSSTTILNTSNKNNSTISTPLGNSTDPFEPPRSPPHEDKCRICLTSSLSDTTMVACEVEICGAWYHIGCLLGEERLYHILIMPSNDLSDTLFVCEDCLVTKGAYFVQARSKARSQLMANLDILGDPVKLLDHLGDTVEVLDGGSPQKLEASDVDFELTRQESYQGYDKKLVDDLVRRLYRSINDYDLEVRDNINRFADGPGPRYQNPLRVWQFIDPGKDTIAGQPWFRIDDAARRQPISYAPITSSLRSIIKTPDGESLRITEGLAAIKFSPLHRGLTAWFAFDVISNAMDLYDLPHMKTYRSLMEAIYSAGDDRWGGSGRHLLREVQLRAWHSEEFQKDMLVVQDKIRHKMEEFLEPLTKDFGKLSQWSHSMSHIAKHTIKLWTYLQSLGGELTLIEPTIGATFDPTTQKPFDEDGIEILSRTTSNPTIAWVLCRGFRYRESNVDGLREYTVKALVVVR